MGLNKQTNFTKTDRQKGRTANNALPQLGAGLELQQQQHGTSDLGHDSF